MNPLANLNMNDTLWMTSRGTGARKVMVAYRVLKVTDRCVLIQSDTGHYFLALSANQVPSSAELAEDFGLQDHGWGDSG